MIGGAQEGVYSVDDEIVFLGATKMEIRIHSCGMKHVSTDNFCPHCGEPLNDEGVRMFWKRACSTTLSTVSGAITTGTFSANGSISGSAMVVVNGDGTVSEIADPGESVRIVNEWNGIPCQCNRTGIVSKPPGMVCEACGGWRDAFVKIMTGHWRFDGWNGSRDAQSNREGQDFADEHDCIVRASKGGEVREWISSHACKSCRAVPGERHSKGCAFIKEKIKEARSEGQDMFKCKRCDRFTMQHDIQSTPYPKCYGCNQTMSFADPDDDDDDEDSDDSDEPIFLPNCP